MSGGLNLPRVSEVRRRDSCVYRHGNTYAHMEDEMPNRREFHAETMIAAALINRRTDVVAKPSIHELAETPR